ncbi:thiolase C-terminal domain-containing protein [Sphingomonas solaris]|uniref:Thiolase n=1 Tax=Alterirhizorhabdus solaris TaxID=2529389 RepID=A0A558RB89_9SPHN|nr:thiolase [Sphingomonas solaris]TVV76621.1 thiolase [Sphingomonas solaris]
MKSKSIAVVGAAETTRMGAVPELSNLGLNLDAALNAMADAGLTPQDIDGIATAGEHPWTVSTMLGIKPKWIDSTNVGGCSYMVHVRHAAAAIAAGYCTTVLITHGESGRSQVAPARYAPNPGTLFGQFESPYGLGAPVTQVTLPALRFMKETDTTEEDLALLAVIQREWAAKNPRAFARDPITVDQVLSSSMIAYPFRKLLCCLVTDGGGALILTSADRAKDFPTKPVYIMGTGEGIEHSIVSMMADMSTSGAFRLSGEAAFASAGITHADVDHVMLYDPFAHVPFYALEDLGFCGRGEAKYLYRERHTAPGGRLPVNTSGGGLSYQHSGMYGMFALQESVRQMRGIAAAQIEGAKVSVCHGIGSMFSAAGTIIFTNEA